MPGSELELAARGWPAPARERRETSRAPSLSSDETNTTSNFLPDSLTACTEDARHGGSERGPAARDTGGVHLVEVFENRREALAWRTPVRLRYRTR